MPTRNVHLTEHFVREGPRALEQREEEDKARIAWLRAAATDGFDAIDRGEFVALNSEEEIDTFLKDIHEEASGELSAERRRD